MNLIFFRDMAEDIPFMLGGARLVWADLLKGMCLFLIVLGHMGTIPDAIRFAFRPTDMVYVGSFFYLSGFLFHIDKYSFPEFCTRKVNSLMIPYFSISLLASLLDWNLYLQTTEFIKLSIYNILMGDGAVKASPLWFVSTLFCANILVKIIYTIRQRWIQLILVFIMPVVCYILYDYEIRLPFRLDSAFGATFLMAAAYEQKRSVANRFLVLISIVVAGFFATVGLVQRVGLLNYNLPHTLVSFPAAVGACYCLHFVFSRVAKEERKWMLPFLWIARNGMFVLGFHCLIGFYINVPLGICDMSSTTFFAVKSVLVFLVLRYGLLSVLRKIKPQLWGL